MMMRKGVLLAALVLGVNVAAHASFEMMLIATDSRIVRYDPVNQIPLGSFGYGELGGYGNYSLAADTTRSNEVAVVNGDGVLRRFNYSTGDFISSFRASAQYFSNTRLDVEVLSNGNYLITGYEGSGAITRIFNASGAAVASLNPFGSSYVPLDCAQAPDGTIYQLNRILNGSNYDYYTFVYNSSGVYQGYNLVASGQTSSRYGFVEIANGRQHIGVGTSFGALAGVSAPLGFLQSFTGMGTSSYFLTTGWGNLNAAHSGRIYQTQSFFDSNTSTYRNYLYKYDQGAGNFSGFIPITGINTYFSETALVVAPEPGTWCALGAGLALLIRKRKR